VISGNDGSANPEPIYITIDGSKHEVSFGESKKRPDITHKFIDLNWPCNAASPCTPLDYGIST